MEIVYRLALETWGFLSILDMDQVYLLLGPSMSIAEKCINYISILDMDLVCHLLGPSMSIGEK